MAGNGRLQTPLLRLECMGLAVGDFAVPPFKVWAGQAVCLHIPPVPATGREALLAVLSGRTADPALRFSGSVGRLDRPMPRRRWWGGLFDPPARDWLLGENGLTAEEALEVLGCLALPAQERIGRLGWNERTLLALEACLLRPPALLIFDTVGNDPLGMQRVFQRLAARPAPLAVVYLKTHCEQHLDCLPDSFCVEIACRAVQTTVVE